LRRVWSQARGAKAVFVSIDRAQKDKTRPMNRGQACQRVAPMDFGQFIVLRPADGR